MREDYVYLLLTSPPGDLTVWTIEPNNCRTWPSTDPKRVFLTKLVKENSPKEVIAAEIAWWIEVDTPRKKITREEALLHML